MVIHKMALSASEVSELLGLGMTKTWALIRSGEILSKRVGRRVIVLADDLKRFIEQCPDYREEQ